MRLSGQLSVAAVVLVVLTAASVGYLAQRNLEDVLVPAELGQVESATRILAERFGAFVNSGRLDVLALSGAPAVSGIARALAAGGIDPVSGQTEARLRSDLERLFASVVRAKGHYVQLRLIGVADAGREIVRVDRDAADGSLRIVSGAALQQKGRRGYFAGTVARAPGDIYVSPIELNQENGTVQVPHLPVLRIGTPIDGPDGRRFGILVVNVDLRPLFRRLQTAVTGTTSLYAVNGEGDFLLHPDPEMSFGFDLGKRHRIGDLFPALSGPAALAGETVKVLPDVSGNEYAVAVSRVTRETGVEAYVVEAVPGATFMASVLTVRRSTLLTALVASLCGIVLAVWIARTLARPIVELAEAVDRRSADGSIALPDAGRGETGVLVQAIRRFVENELLFRATLESAGDAIITQTLDGTVTSWNPAAETLYGYSSEEAVGQSIGLIIPADRRSELSDILARIARGERVENFETVRRSKSGNQVQVSLTVSPVRNAEGTIIGVSKIAHDITRRNQMARMVRLAVDANPTGMIVANRAGGIEMANAAVSQMFGYPQYEMIGMQIEELVPPRSRAQHLVDREAYQVSPDARSMSMRTDLSGLRRDGSEFHVEVALNPLSAGTEAPILAVVVDITERRRIETEREERRAELERSNAELAQFAYVASHDLQEPLRMVSSFCELLEQSCGDRLNADEREYIGFAVDGARRMQQLITDLLAFSRLNTRAPAVKPTSCAGAVEAALRNLEIALEESGGVVAYGELPEVRCDPTQAVMLFQNLLSNAIKFRAAEPPHIRIDAQRDGAFWRFSVADNGIGIDPKHAGVVFGLFQRLHTRDEYPGTGIGLAICQKIVERNGGTIWVEPGEGPGTTFGFTLPAADGVPDGS